MKHIQLQEAKAKFCEIAREIKSGPYVVTIRGKEELIMMSMEEFLSRVQPDQSFGEILDESPLKAENIKLEREQLNVRELDFE